MYEEKKTIKKRGGRLFVKGNPGGPGHPKGVTNFKTRFFKYLEECSQLEAPADIINALKEQFPKLERNLTVSKAQALRVHLAALSGESWAYDRLFDRPGQAVDVTTQGEKLENKATFVLSSQKVLDGMQEVIERENKNASIPTN